MTLNTAQFGDDFALVGADYRWSDGPGTAVDLGGKLTWTRTGWSVAGGPGDGRVSSIAQQGAAALTDGSPEDFCRVYAELAQAWGQRIWGPASELYGKSYAMVSRIGRDGPEVFQVSSDGQIWDGEPGRISYSVLEGTPTSEVDALEERLSGANEVHEAVRRIARGAVELTKDSPVVSPELLIAGVVRGADGFERRTWKAPARELAEAADQQLNRLAQPFRRPSRRVPVEATFTEPPVRTFREDSDDIFRRSSQTGSTDIKIGDVAFSGGQVKVQHSGEEYELYTYDPDTSSSGGVCVGVRDADSTGVGSNAGDFTLRVGAEDVTVTGGENCGLDENTKYHVGWDRENSNLITSTNRQDSLGRDITHLGSTVSTVDLSTGSGDPGDVGSSTDQTLK